MVNQIFRVIRVIPSVLTVLSKRYSSQFLVSSTKNRNMEVINTLKQLGYAFNSAGQLRKVNAKGEITEEPFQFNISDNHQECQAHYEQIGNTITPYIYHLLETQEKLMRLPVPRGNTEGTFVFASDDYAENDVLLVLIHGSGVVRAGQWARSLIINENLDCGSQIPYIRNGLAYGYGVIVMNTNDNLTAEGKKIPHSGSHEEHAVYVWNTYIADAKAKSILIVAHSYGGVVTVYLADKLKDDFEKRVKAIAFTDSVHSYSTIKVSEHMKKVTKNWISSKETLDTPIKTPDFDVQRLSAGHTKHEMTSYCCLESVFRFFEEQLKKKEIS